MSDKRIVKAFQNQDDSWIIEIARPGGLVIAEKLPPLTKEQAMAEVLRRGYAGAEIYDKEVVKAISEGRVVGIKLP